MIDSKGSPQMSNVTKLQSQLQPVPAADKCVRLPFGTASNKKATSLKDARLNSMVNMQLAKTNISRT